MSIKQMQRTRHGQNGASPLICVFDGRLSLEMVRRVFAIGLFLLMGGCATKTWYARRPLPEQSSHLAAAALRPGMTLYNVVVVMLDVRRPNQYASLDSAGSCPDESVNVVVHAGELLAKVGGTAVHEAGFASIRSLKAQSLRSEGFERQATLLGAVRAREGELLVCRDVVLAFDSVTEGGCGRDTIALTFAEDGRLDTVGLVASEGCAHSWMAPSNDEMQLTGGEGGAHESASTVRASY